MPSIFISESSVIVSIIILCALFDGMKTSFGSKPLSDVLGVVSTLCICACVVAPIVECINNLSSIIQNSSNFMLLYVPVITGIMISSGQTLSAGNYNFMMVILGDTISQIVSRLLVPMLNMVLAVAVVSYIYAKLWNQLPQGIIFGECRDCDGTLYSGRAEAGLRYPDGGCE